MDKFHEGFLVRSARQSHSFGTMQPGLSAQYSDEFRSPEALSQTQLFCAKFKRALHECIRHHFSVEEAFGMIWVEILEEVPLLPHEQARVYEALIQWARNCAVSELFSVS